MVGEREYSFGRVGVGFGFYGSRYRVGGSVLGVFGEEFFGGVVRVEGVVRL